jgi:Skp family chaperone for outer membrane proteins
MLNLKSFLLVNLFNVKRVTRKPIRGSKYEKLAQKREQLFSPILDRVNQAMSDVAKENQFMFVFDSSSQVLLYSDETLDVTKLVKAKLGIAN